MSKLMIIGAGGVGNVVAQKCAQLPEIFSEIVLASRTESKCKAIAAQLQQTIRTAQIDADIVPQLTELLKKEQPDLVINVALPYQDLTIMDAALIAGVHYLDTANYEPLDTAKFEYRWQWEYQQRFFDAGLTALLGSGFDPGATNIFTAYLAKHYFDEIHELDIILLLPISTPRSTSGKSAQNAATGRMASLSPRLRCRSERATPAPMTLAHSTSTACITKNWNHLASIFRVSDVPSSG